MTLRLIAHVRLASKKNVATKKGPILRWETNPQAWNGRIPTFRKKEEHTLFWSAPPLWGPLTATAPDENGAFPIFPNFLLYLSL